jgi:hypothetical protein
MSIANVAGGNDADLETAYRELYESIVIRVRFVALSTLTLQSQWHLWHSRPHHDLFLFSGGIGIVAALLCVNFILEYERFRFVSAFAVMSLLFAPVFGAATGLWLYGLFVDLQDLPTLVPGWIAWARQFGPLVTVFVSSVIGSTICTIGVGLFLFRLHRRSCYGATEALVGAFIGISKAIDAKTSLASANLWLALLTASIYLLVRGLDNIHQGLTREPMDPWAAGFASRIKQRLPRLHRVVRRATR